MKRSLLPILTGIVCFGIALWQSTTVEYYNWDCSFKCNTLLGKIATVGIGLSISWLFYREIFSKKR